MLAVYDAAEALAERFVEDAPESRGSLRRISCWFVSAKASLFICFVLDETNDGGIAKSKVSSEIVTH